MADVCKGFPKFVRCVMVNLTRDLMALSGRDVMVEVIFFLGEFRGLW